MAALSITAANVKWVSGVNTRIVRGGESGTRGQAVFYNSSTNEYELADADAAGEQDADGILLTDMVDGADCLIAVPGATINIGATTTAGIPYCVDPTTPGAIVPYSDLGSGDTPVLLFWGSGTANVTLVCAVSPAAIG